MKANQEYRVTKDIPLNNGKSIKEGSQIMRTHGLYYLEGNLLSPDYQNDFDTLIESEENNGWNYIVPVKKKTVFGNDGTKLY